MQLSGMEQLDNIQLQVTLYFPADFSVNGCFKSEAQDPVQ